MRRTKTESWLKDEPIDLGEFVGMSKVGRTLNDKLANQKRSVLGKWS